MYRYEDPYLDPAMDTNKYLSSQYYAPRGAGMYSTLPSKKTQYFQDNKTERSVTPDITRGLERREQNLMRFQYQNQHQNLGIPVQMPDINRLNLNQVPYLKQQSYEDINESLRISPIDPRHSGSFKSSTPSYKTTELKATSNLESKLMSPKKSTMSNEELYAVIHKSKKKMNIEDEETPRSSPVTVQSDQSMKQTMKTPESGYLDRSKSRLSWSPSNGEYVEFNNDIDKLSPPNDSRTRQSWACSDRTPKVKQTSTIDFKRLLLQKSATSTPKKLSAVEQLKLSKQQIKSPQPKGQPEMNILDLSGSPRSLVNRRFLANNAPGSPNRDPKSVAKVLSPRSQWRFANPRSDVLSSTILEDCREDESPNSSGERRSPRNRNRDSPKKDGSPRTYQREESSNIGESLYKEATTPKKSSPKGMPRYETTPYSSASQRLYAQRAQFFQPINRSPEGEKKTAETCSPPTLETAF